MKITKKIVIPVIAVAVIGAAAFFVPKIVSASGAKTTTVSATPLEKMNIENTVSVTGTIKSKDATNVYSTLSDQVKIVNVEVGDRVNAGDVLCELDESDLTAKIDQSVASISQSQAKAQHNLAVAKNNLEIEQFKQENNFNEKLASAESAVEKTRQNVETEKLNLQSAQIDLREKKRLNSEYRDANGEGDPEILATIRKAEVSVTKAEDAVEEAKRLYEEAKESLKTVQIQLQEAIVTGKQQVTTAELNANFTEQQLQLDELKKSLEDTVVKAPVSGIVTAVLAVEGGSGQGLLFVIEDTENLKIDTKVKEYDIASVSEGQTAKIKSDATGDEEFIGKVSKIAPTAVKDSKGETVETTDAQFVVEIDVTGTSGLKIGMNVRIEIVTDEKTDVFAVPYDAVIENEKGEQVVYVARPQLDAGGKNAAEGEAAADAEPAQKGNKAADAGFTVASMPVQTGLETDFYIEITSDSLREGDLIISDPSGLTDGMSVSLGAGSVAGARGAGGGPGGPGGGVAVRMG